MEDEGRYVGREIDGVISHYLFPCHVILPYVLLYLYFTRLFGDLTLLNEAICIECINLKESGHMIST